MKQNKSTQNAKQKKLNSTNRSPSVGVEPNVRYILLFISIVAVSVWLKFFGDAVVFVTKFNPVRSIKNVVVFDASPKINTVPIVIESGIFNEMALSNMIFPGIYRPFIWGFWTINRVVRIPNNIMDGLGSLPAQQNFNVRTVPDIVSRGSPVVLQW